MLLGAWRTCSTAAFDGTFFLCKRARPDIQNSIAFLGIRVKSPCDDDCKKLARAMKSVHGNINLPLVLEADNMHVVKTWVDASFAVHSYTKSHTDSRECNLWNIRTCLVNIKVFVML